MSSPQRVIHSPQTPKFFSRLEAKLFEVFERGGEELGLPARLGGTDLTVTVEILRRHIAVELLEQLVGLLLGELANIERKRVVAKDRGPAVLLVDESLE